MYHSWGRLMQQIFGLIRDEGRLWKILNRAGCLFGTGDEQSVVVDFRVMLVPWNIFFLLFHVQWFISRENCSDILAQPGASLCFYPE